MRTKAIVTIVALFGWLQCYGQLSIDECYEKARANYPSIRQYDLIEKSRQYNLSNAGSGYLPQISISAKGSYQSEVTSLPIAIDGIEGLRRDQYGATIDVNQTIWDGGVVRAKKESIRSLSEVDKKNVDVELYSLNERINQIYFGILLFDAQLEQNRLYNEELQRNFDRVNNSLKNGTANKADLDAVMVEQVSSNQKRSQLIHSKTAYVGMLAALVGEKLPTDIKLVKPEDVTQVDTTNNRLELQLFDAQKKNLEVQNSQITAELMPKFGAYVTGGYGRPGLNMLTNKFSPYYVAGLKLSWNISSFYNVKNSRRLVQNNIAAVDVKEKTFLFNSNIDIATKLSEIDKYRDQLKYDDQIISLRNSVKLAAEAKMANGTISGTDLMREVTAEELAKQDKIYHNIELLLAQYNLKYLTNNF